jgi:hypothetical protein
VAISPHWLEKMWGVPAETVPVPDVLVQTCIKRGETMVTKEALEDLAATNNPYTVAAYLAQTCTHQGETMDPTSRPSTSSDEQFSRDLEATRAYLASPLADHSRASFGVTFVRELIARYDAARATAEGLARRVAEQSELLSRRSEKFPLPSSAATEAALADLTNELMPYLASRGLAPAVDSWAELNGRLRVWALNRRVRMGMEVSTPERDS